MGTHRPPVSAYSESGAVSRSHTPHIDEDASAYRLHQDVSQRARTRTTCVTVPWLPRFHAMFCLLLHERHVARCGLNSDNGSARSHRRHVFDTATGTPTAC